MTRRYYLGGQSIVAAVESSGTCPILRTLPEAIAQASLKINTQASDVEYIVEIVKIVRRKPVETPVIVEDVI